MTITVVRLPHPVTTEGAAVAEAPAGSTPAELGAADDDEVLVNGVRAALDAPAPSGAVVSIRPALAGGDDSDPLRTVLQVALLLATIGLAVSTGGWFAGLAGWAKAATLAAIQIGGNLVINAIAPPPPPPVLPRLDAAADQPEPVYSLTGGANRARPWQPLPLVLGTHRLFPDLAAAEYTTYSAAPRAAELSAVATRAAGDRPAGLTKRAWEALQDLPEWRAAPRRQSPGGSNDQYLWQIFHWGLGDLSITDLRVGDTPLSDLDDVTTDPPVAANAVSLPAAAAQTLVAGDVSTVGGAALPDAANAWVSRTTQTGVTRIEIDLVGRIFKIANNALARHSVDVLVELWPAGADGDGNDYSARKRAHTLTLAHSDQTPYRATVSYAGLDAAATSGDADHDGDWVVRVARRKRASADDAEHDDVAFQALRGFRADTTDYSGHSRLGMRVRASGQLSGRIDRLSGLASQRVPVWDGAAWTVGATSNPAWIYRWYALGVRVAGRLVAGVGLPAARVDDELIKQWGAWCDAEGLGCNAVLDREMSHQDALSLIARTGRAACDGRWGDGQRGALDDRSRSRAKPPRRSEGLRRVPQLRRRGARHPHRPAARLVRVARQGARQHGLRHPAGPQQHPPPVPVRGRREIVMRFVGRNCHHLARIHRLSQRQVRRIAARGGTP